MQEDKRIRTRLLGAAVAVGATLAATAARAETNAPEERVVYHVDDLGLARDALVNIANHLAHSPQAKIALVANGRGVRMLAGNDFGSQIAELQTRGVRFVACQTAMQKQGIDAKSLLPAVQQVPSGVVELARLQLAERHAYIKP